MGRSRHASLKALRLFAAATLAMGSLIAAGAGPAAGTGSGDTLNHTSATRVGSVDVRHDGVATTSGSGTRFGFPSATGGNGGELRALRQPGARVPVRTSLPHWLPQRAGPTASNPARTAKTASRGTLATEIAPAAAGSQSGGLRSEFGTFGLSDADDSLLYSDCSVFELCEEPPDPSVAASATSVVQTVNELVYVIDRESGASRVIPNFDFFSLDSNQVNQTDPRVLFDTSRNRWLATEISADCDHSYLHIAVSSSGDPFGVWTVYRIVFPGRVVDFPGVGTTNDTVVVGLNAFGPDPESSDCLAPGDFQGAMLVIADWSDLQQAVPSLPVTTTEPDAGLFTWRPATSAGGDPLGRLIVAIDTGSEDAADVGYATVSGTNAARNVAVSPVIDLTKDKGLAPFAQPPQPRQPGDPATIARAVDGDPTDAISAGGRMWFIATAPCTPPDDSGSRDCVRVTELTLGSTPAAVAVVSDIRLQEQGADLYMGGIGRSLDGTLFVVYTRSSRVDRIAAYATWRRSTESAFNDAALLIPGGGDYSGQRWGDYVTLSPDPSRSDAVWQSHQVANADESWFTWISQIRPAPAGPLAGSLKIDGGDDFAGETFVDLRFANPPDVALTVVRVSNSPKVDGDGRLAGGLTMPAAEDLPWSLEIDQPEGGPPDGVRHVYVQWGDGRGTWGPVATDSIVLDTEGPTVGAVAAPVVARTTLTKAGDVPVVITWGPGQDSSSGLEGYDVEIRQDGGEWDYFSSPVAPRTTGEVRAGHRYQWRVRAFDRVGNPSDWSEGPTVRINAVDDASSSIVYGSGWRRSTASSSYKGGVHTTSTGGATATISFTGRGFAVVGTTRPGGGVLQVFVDGRPAGTFDQSTPPAGASRIGYFRRWLASGRHTVTLVALDGRRVDLDALILLR